MPRKIIRYGLFAFLCFSYIVKGQIIITGNAGVCTGGSSTLGVACSNFTPPQTCSTTLNMSSGTTTLTPGNIVCFYDSGGPNGDYGNSENYTRTFTSSNGTPVYIYFNSFSVGNNSLIINDYIYVYDGPNTSGTRLNSSSTSGLSGNLYIATSGSLTVKFESNWIGTNSGWSAVVGCNAYQWSTGETTATITVSPSVATNYTVTVSGFFNGTASQNVAVVDCNASACPEVAPAEFGTGLTDIEGTCARRSVTLSANAVATSRTADNYFAVSIPYDPPYGFTDGTRIFTNAQDDTWGTAVTLPFGFCYYGTTYTQIVPGANAVATFNASSEGTRCEYSYSASLPSTSLFTNTIFACYRDIYPNYYSGDGIYEGILGNYPCRSYMLSFNNIALYGSSSDDSESNYCLSDHSFSSMIVLYEGTNIIDIYLRDAPSCPEWNGGRGLLGIQNGDGSLATVPPGRNTGSWTAHNEAWRFIPIGTPEYTVTWYLGTDTSATTGVVLGEGDTWRAELDRVLAPQRFAFAPSAAIAPVSAYVSAAERAFDGRLAPMQVVFPEHAGDPVQVMGAPAGVARKSAKLLAAWLDPATAVVIDKGDPQAGVLGALNVVHKTLLLPVVGHDAVGWAGLALLASCVSGLWLWWPRKGGPLKGLRWTRGASQLFNLHHMVGVCAGLPLALAALTGVYLAFPGVVATLFGAAAPPQPAPRMLHVGPIATADDALARIADVQLKERRPLILVPRETPLNLIHLRNMTALTEAGAIIAPAAPGFYNRPDSLDTLIDGFVARLLQLAGLAPLDAAYRWKP